MPELSDRRNIVVLADEAHRSQYNFIAGFARHIRDALPNASFIGFTGTPIEAADRNTPAVFGEYIDVYDIQRAVDDKATIPIYYESRLVQIELDELERETIEGEVADLGVGARDRADGHAAQRGGEGWGRVGGRQSGQGRSGVGQAAAGDWCGAGRGGGGGAWKGRG